MYTTVFYDGDIVIDTQESKTIPKIKEAKFDYYVQEGEFDGVLDPSKGIDTRSREEQLQDELTDTKQRLKITEDTFFQFLNE